MEILVFDDDPQLAEITGEALAEEGFECRLFLDGFDALETIRRKRPGLVVLDVLMPGMDGLSICRTLKADPSTADLPVVLMSGKAYPQDRREALLAGAQAFLAKPFRPEQLLGSVREALGREPKPAAARDDGRRMRLSVWGQCLSVELEDKRLVLGGGAGLAALAGQAPPPVPEVWLLLAGRQAAHTSELAPGCAAFAPSVRLNVVTPPAANPLARELPALSGPGAGRSKFYHVSGGTFQPWPGVRISCRYARHPGLALAYRVEWAGRSLLYCPANEALDSEAGELEAKLLSLARGADLMVHDARYNEADNLCHRGEGHSSPAMAADLAARAGARCLLLFGSDPGYGTRELAESLAEARRRVQSRPSPPLIELASQGAVFTA